MAKEVHKDRKGQCPMQATLRGTWARPDLAEYIDKEEHERLLSDDS